MSRARELASSLVRCHTRVKTAERLLASFTLKHKDDASSRQVKNRQRLMADLMLAQNDAAVLERMLKSECERA